MFMQNIVNNLLEELNPILTLSLNNSLLGCGMLCLGDFLLFFFRFIRIKFSLDLLLCALGLCQQLPPILPLFLCLLANLSKVLSTDYLLHPMLYVFNRLDLNHELSPYPGNYGIPDV